MPAINPHDIPEQIAVKVASHEPRPHSRRFRREKSGLLRRYVGYEFTRLSLSSSPNLPSGRRGNSCGDVPSGRGASPRRRRVQPGNRTLRPPVQRERGGGAKNDTNSRQKEALIYAYSPQTPATAVTNTSTGSTSDKHQRTNKRLTLLCALVLPLGGRTPRRSWVPSPAANHVSFAAGHSCLDGRTGQGQKKEKKVGVLIHPTGSRLCYGEVPSLIAVLSSQKVKRAARRGMYTRGKSTENPKRYRPNVTQHKEDAPCKCYVRGQQTSGLAG